MKACVCCLLAAVLSLAFASRRQAAASLPEPPLPLRAEEPLQVFETVEVRLVHVDVVVTDKKGNPVSGLTRDDFVILENGIPQAITHFSEVVTEAGGMPAAAAAVQAAAAAAPSRKIILFIDNLSLGQFTRNRFFRSMKEFVRDSLRPGVQVMIVTWDHSIQTRLAFTDDGGRIQQVLDAIAAESALGLHALSERHQAQTRIRWAHDFDEALVIAREYAQSIENGLRQSVAAVNSLIGTLGGVEGKKAMLLVSEGFPIQPGSDMFQYVNEVWGRGSSLLESRSIMEALSFNAKPRIDSVTRAANANGITLYTFHAGGSFGQEQISAASRTPISRTLQKAILDNSSDSLRLMAKFTGGLAAVDTNSFHGALERVQRDLSSYYSLGYSARSERVDRQRSLQVTAKNNQYVTRSRRSFVEKSIGLEMGDKVVAHLFFAGNENTLGIQARTGRPLQLANGKCRVPLEVLIPIRSLTLRPQDGVAAGSFSVYVVVANRFGDMSEVSRQQHAIRIPSSEIDRMRSSPYALAIDLIMRFKDSKISVGVVDDASHVSGFRQIDFVARDSQ